MWQKCYGIDYKDKCIIFSLINDIISDVYTNIKTNKSAQDQTQLNGSLRFLQVTESVHFLPWYPNTAVTKMFIILERNKHIYIYTMKFGRHNALWVCV